MAIASMRFQQLSKADLLRALGRESIAYWQLLLPSVANLQVHNGWLGIRITGRLK